MKNLARKLITIVFVILVLPVVVTFAALGSACIIVLDGLSALARALDRAIGNV